MKAHEQDQLARFVQTGRDFMKSQTRATQKPSRSLASLRHHLWDRVVKEAAFFVINAALTVGSKLVESVEQPKKDRKMLVPETTKEFKHQQWCAIMWSDYVECDCEEK